MLEPVVPILGVALVAVGVAGLMHRAGLPGAPLVAGLLVGVLAGPDVLGRAAPETFERSFRGGGEARERLERLERIETLGRAAAGEVEVEIEVFEIPSEDLSDTKAALRSEIERTESTRRRVPVAAVLACAVLLLATSIRDGLGAWRRCGARRSEALLLGAWVAVLPAGLGMALLHSTVVDAAAATSVDDWAMLLLIASAFAIGPWRLGGADADRASASEPGGADLVRASGLVATAMAFSAAAASAWLSESMLPALVLGSAVVLGAILGVVGNGSLRPAAAPGAVETSADPSTSRWRSPSWLVAPMVAIAMLDIAPLRDFAWWPVLVAVILTADGRYLGAVIAGVMPGTRRGLRAMRLLMPLTVVGPTQTAVASVVSISGGMSPEFALALFIGAAIPEVTAPLRASTDRHLREAEALTEAVEQDRPDR